MTHRTPALSVTLATALLLACGDSRVTVVVDVLSFLDPSEATVEYGKETAIPGNVPSVTARSAPVMVPLAQEVDISGTIESVLITADVEFTHATGTTGAQFAVYLSGAGEDPYMSPPVVADSLLLAPGDHVTRSYRVAGDRRLLDLFAQQEILLGSEVVILPTGGTEGISGEATLTKLLVTLTSGGSL